MREAIQIWENKLKTATGKDTFTIKHTLIELRKDQYVIKNAYRKPITPTKLTPSKHEIKLDGKEWIDEEGSVLYSGISLLDPKVCEAILCNYTKLKDSYESLEFIFIQ